MAWNLEKLLSDPFLQERINPLLLQEVAAYTKVDGSIQRSLALFLFKKLLQPIYLKYTPKQKGTIFFLSTISSDGIGDFIALNKCAKLFYENYPGFTAKIAYTFQRDLPKWPSTLETYTFKDPEYLIEKIVEGVSLPDFQMELKDIQEALIRNEQDYQAIQKKSALAAEAIAEYHLELQSKLKKMQRNSILQMQGTHFYNELLQCSAIVNISLAFNTFDNPLLAKKSLYFSEAGNFQGIGMAEHLNWYSMGLHPFEEGLFLKQQEKQSQEKKYLSYITTISNVKLCYIYLICIINNSGNLEILLNPLSKEEISGINLEFLEELNISTIYFDEHQVKTANCGGRSLLIKQKLPLPYGQFLKEMSSCANPIGCTGDLSLSEVISFGKIPFYEMRPHKIETMTALKKIANFLQLNLIEKYLSHLEFIENPKSSALVLADLLQTETFLNQWQALNAFLHRYYCFEDSFIARMNAFFAIQNNLNWKLEEETILAQDLSVKEKYLIVIDKLL